MVRPILKTMLYHTVTYEEYNGSSWGEEYGSPVTVENVLVQPVSSLNRTNNTDGKSFGSILFYDERQSTPGIKWEVGSRVTFGEDTMTVNKVNPYYAFSNTIHHIEVELS